MVTIIHWFHCIICKYKVSIVILFIHCPTGLVEGYSFVAPASESIDVFGFDFLAGNGDWLDIQTIIGDNGFFKNKMNFYPKGHCSVLFKVLPGYENIFASHSRSVILFVYHFISCFLHF